MTRYTSSSTICTIPRLKAAVEMLLDQSNPDAMNVHSRRSVDLAYTAAEFVSNSASHQPSSDCVTVAKVPPPACRGTEIGSGRKTEPTSRQAAG